MAEDAQTITACAAAVARGLRPRFDVKYDLLASMSPPFNPVDSRTCERRLELQEEEEGKRKEGAPPARRGKIESWVEKFVYAESDTRG